MKPVSKYIDNEVYNRAYTKLFDGTSKKAKDEVSTIIDLIIRDRTTLVIKQQIAHNRKSIV